MRRAPPPEPKSGPLFRLCEAVPPWIEPVPESIRAQDDWIATCLVNSGHIPESSVGEVLARGEQEELTTLTHPGRRREWLAARIAVKWLLIQRGVIATWRDAEVRKDGSGKPFVVLVADGQSLPLDISISHKGELAVAALARVPAVRIGVDLEVLSSRPERLKNAFEHPSDALSEIRRPDPYFTILWTLKEAAAKVLGLGVGSLPNLMCRQIRDDVVCEIRYETDGRVLRAVHGIAGTCVISLAWTPSPSQ